MSPLVCITDSKIDWDTRKLFKGSHVQFSEEQKSLFMTDLKQQK